MPTFFPSVLDLDISVDEFLSHFRDGYPSGSNSREHIYKGMVKYFEDKSNMEKDFVNKCKDLSEKFYQLDNEAIEYIESLHKKWC